MWGGFLSRPVVGGGGERRGRGGGDSAIPPPLSLMFISDMRHTTEDPERSIHIGETLKAP